MGEHNYDFDEDDWPEDAVACDRCDGDGEVTCHCGGDMCLCGRFDVPCPVCGGDGHITKERWEKRAKIHKEIMDAIWNRPNQQQEPTE